MISKDTDQSYTPGCRTWCLSLTQSYWRQVTAVVQYFGMDGDVLCGWMWCNITNTHIILYYIVLNTHFKLEVASNTLSEMAKCFDKVNGLP